MLKDKSYEYYLDYLAVLDKEKVDIAHNKEFGDPNAKNIHDIFEDIPKDSEIVDIGAGNLDSDKSLEVAILSYTPIGIYLLQIYKRDEHSAYVLSQQSLPIIDDKKYKNFKYFIDRGEIDLGIEDRLLYFSVRAKGHQFNDDRKITNYFSLSKNKLILKYSLNLWQEDGMRGWNRDYFVIDYTQQSIVKYPKHKEFSVDILTPLLKGNKRKFDLNKPIELANYTHVMTHEVFDSVYYPSDRKLFETDLEKAAKYYKKKQFKKIKSLFGEKKINSLHTSYPISNLNIIQYNDIAFYLQKAGNHKRAIEILERIISFNPGRNISYLNVADSYAALKQNNKADQNYFHYLQRINLNEKEIPSYLSNRYSGTLLSLSQNNKRQKLLYSTTGDLNNDRKNDLVFILQNIDDQSTTTIIYFLDTQKYSEIFKSTTVLGENNIEEFSGIKINKSSLFLHFTSHSIQEDYQFILKNSRFTLIGLESYYFGRGEENVTSINFLTKKLISKNTYFEYKKETDEPVKKTSKKTQKFMLKKSIKLENFNHDYPEIINTVFSSIR